MPLLKAPEENTSAPEGSVPEIFKIKDPKGAPIGSLADLKVSTAIVDSDENAVSLVCNTFGAIAALVLGTIAPDAPNYDKSTTMKVVAEKAEEASVQRTYVKLPSVLQLSNASSTPRSTKNTCLKPMHESIKSKPRMSQSKLPVPKPRKPILRIIKASLSARVNPVAISINVAK